MTRAIANSLNAAATPLNIFIPDSLLPFTVEDRSLPRQDFRSVDGVLQGESILLVCDSFAERGSQRLATRIGESHESGQMGRYYENVSGLAIDSPYY
jgi:hypothetical protein